MALATLTIDINARLANIERDLGRVSHLADQAGQRMRSSFAAAGSAVAGMAAGLASFASIGAFRSILDDADALNDLSQRIGVGVKDLGTWKLATEQSGTSMESLGRAIKGLAQYQQEHSDKLRAMGVTATDANGAMIQLADVFARMPDGLRKTALAADVFGKAGMDLIPMLNMGSKGLAEAADSAKDYAERLARLAPEADKLNDSLARLSLSAKGFGMDVAGPIVEGLNKTISGFEGARKAGFGFWQSLTGVGLRGLNENWDEMRSNVDQHLAETRTAIEEAKAAIARGEKLGYADDVQRGKYDLEVLQKKLGYYQAIRAEKVAVENAASYSNEGRLATPVIPGDPDKKTASRISEGERLLRQLQERAAVEGKVTEVMRLQAQIEAGLVKFDNERQRSSALAAAQRIDDERAWAESARKSADDAARAHNDWLRVIEENSRRAASLYGGTKQGQADRIADDLRFMEAMNALGEVSDAQLQAFKDSLDEVKDKGKSAFEQLTEAVEGWGKASANAFAEFVVDGKGSISDLARHVLKEFISLQTTPVFSDLLKGGTSFLRSLLPNADGGVYNSPSLSAYSNGVYESPHLFKFASGAGVFGEAGPEAIMPLWRGADGKLGVKSSGGDAGLTVNLIEAPGKGGAVNRRTGSNGAPVLDIMVEQIKAAVASDIRSGNGVIPAALQGTYGVNRAWGGGL